MGFGGIAGKEEKERYEEKGFHGIEDTKAGNEKRDTMWARSDNSGISKICRSEHFIVILRLIYGTN